jgi:multiple sugar transport system substrate-binding protein
MAVGGVFPGQAGGAVMAGRVLQTWRRRLRGAILLCGLAALAAPARAETVRMVTAEYSAATGPYFRSMAADFMRANPGIDVKIEVVNWDTLLQKLQTDVAGGVAPDISIIATRWLLDFVRDGLAEPLDAYADAAFRDRFIGAFLEPSRIGGKLYGLPVAASARALYYNTALLQQAGIAEPPATWDALVADCEKMAALHVACFGVQGKGIETNVYWYYSLWTHGGEVLTPGKQAAFASPQGVASLALYKSMIDRGLTEEGVTGYSREDLQNLFKQGRLGFVITAPFLMTQIAKEAPGLGYGVAPLPAAGARTTYAVTDSIVLFKSSKVKPAAWKFLDYLVTKGPRVGFTKGEGFLPTTKEEAADAAFDDPRLRAFIAMLPEAHFPPLVTGEEAMAQAVTDAVQSVYLGRSSPSDALARAAATSDAALGR